MVYPDQRVTLLLQPQYGLYCLPAHTNKIWVDPVKDLGFMEYSEMSIRMAIRIALYMGCHQINFVACDSLTNGDTRTLDVTTGASELTAAAENYRYISELVLSDLERIPHAFIEPQEAYV